MSGQYPTPISIAGSYEEPEYKRQRSSSNGPSHPKKTHDGDQDLIRLLSDSQRSKADACHQTEDTSMQDAHASMPPVEIGSMENDLFVWGYMLSDTNPSLSFLLSKESRCGKDKSKGNSKAGDHSPEGIKLKDYNGDNIASSGYLLGSNSECDVVINYPGLCERHCVIFKINATPRKREAGDGVVRQIVYLQDISGQGTYINGSKVTQNEVRQLHNYDRISLEQGGPTWTYRAPHSKSHLSFEERFSVGRTIGRGHFAEVHEVTDRKSGSKYAVKIIKKKMITEDKTFLQEIGLLMSCTHPLITCIRDVFDTESEMYLVLELAAGGELFDRIIQKGKFSEDETRSLFSQLFSALQYLHDHNIVHRDIKPENILLTSPNTLEIRLADFGLAKIITNKSATTTLAGTPSYIPPEMLGSTSPGHPLTYTDKVDSWSAGVVLYICLCGFPPFSQELPPPMKTQIKEGLYQFQRPYWDTVSDEAVDLVQRLLTVDPAKRLGVAEALQHPFMLCKNKKQPNADPRRPAGEPVRKGPKRQRTMIADIGRAKFLE